MSTDARAARYAHLAGLFAERERLPADHPDQPRLRERLILGHLPLARNIARRYARRGERLEDLEQVAVAGLVGAVDRYRPVVGSGFLAYAVPTVTGEVLRHLRDRVPAVRVPRRIRSLRRAVYEADLELTAVDGRAPRPSAIAARLGVDVAVVDEVLVSLGARECRSLDAPWTGPGSTDGAPRHAAALASTDPDLEHVENRHALRQVVAGLTDRQRRLLALRFHGELTQADIAARLGTTQPTVSRELDRTLGQLRRRLAS